MLVGPRGHGKRTLGVEGVLVRGGGDARTVSYWLLVIIAGTAELLVSLTRTKRQRRRPIGSKSFAHFQARLSDGPCARTSDVRVRVSELEFDVTGSWIDVSRRGTLGKWRTRKDLLFERKSGC